MPLAPHHAVRMDGVRGAARRRARATDSTALGRLGLLIASACILPSASAYSNSQQASSPSSTLHSIGNLPDRASGRGQTHFSPGVQRKLASLGADGDNATTANITELLRRYVILVREDKGALQVRPSLQLAEELARQAEDPSQPAFIAHVHATLDLGLPGVLSVEVSPAALDWLQNAATTSQYLVEAVEEDVVLRAAVLDEDHPAHVGTIGTGLRSGRVLQDTGLTSKAGADSGSTAAPAAASAEYGMTDVPTEDGQVEGSDTPTGKSYWDWVYSRNDNLTTTTTTDSSSNTTGSSSSSSDQPGLTSGMPFSALEGAVAQFDAPFSLDRIDQRRLPLDATYRYSGDGAGVDVYIMDSGVRTSHREFSGRWVAGKNFSPDQAEDDWSDCAGHGTHVASLAVGTNFGVAKGATLIPTRIYDCDNSGPLSQALQGIDWVVARLNGEGKGRKAVINMSFGGPISTILNRAVTKLTEAGAVVIVAAGNDAKDSCVISPASARDSLTVGATNSDDTWASYSNHGQCVDLLAPGTRIPGAGKAADDAVKLMSGSSMASPLVTGSAARYLQANPKATPGQVKQALLCSATADAIKEVPSNTKDDLLYDPANGWKDMGCAVGGAGAASPRADMGPLQAGLLLTTLSALVVATVLHRDGQ